MRAVGTAEKYCIIGAGAAGITAAKNLKQMGIPCDVIERSDDVGGNWNYGKPNSSVYRSVHLISSKPLTQYTDFPIPDDYPTFLGQAQAWEYLRSYARAFGIYEHIEFGRSVEQVTPIGLGEAWKVRLDGGDIRQYRGVIIANGHLWKPRFPEYPGTFTGRSLHSSQYKTPDVLRGKRVLVVGAGNSGCDIAVEACQNAAHTFHSMRRGYFFYPKYMFGLPSDLVYEFTLKFHLPMFIRRFFGELMLKLNSAGSARVYGLAKPDHKLFDEHIIINSTLFYHLGHGDLTAKPNVEQFLGDRVRFCDGSEETIDVIIYATGFHLSEFPFIGKQHLNWQNNHPNLYLNIFHPRYDNLFVVGMFQTNTGNWPLMDYQSQLVSRFIHAQTAAVKKAESFGKLKAGRPPALTPGLHFNGSPRFAIEVEHYSYRARLKKLIDKMDTAHAPMAARSTSSGYRNEVLVRDKISG